MNIPVGLLIWVMIIPMLMKIDFSALREVYAQRASMGITLFVNWAIAVHHGAAGLVVHQTGLRLAAGRRTGQLAWPV